MSPKDQQNLSVIEQKDNGNGNDNGNNGNGNGIQIDIKRPHLDERFITNIKGKDFVLYAGILSLAHQMGLKKLQVKPIQFPNSENGHEAICLAVAETQDGKVTEDIGDCNPTNCHSMVSKHLIRMASTRAKARALRDLTNIGITCIDEIGNFDELIENEEYPQEPKPRTRKRRSTKANNESQQETKSDNLPGSGNGSNGEKLSEPPKTDQGTIINNNGGKSPLSKTQYRAILNISHRRGISEEQLDKMCIDMFNKHLQFLDSSEGSSMISTLQTSVNPLA